VWVNLKDGVYGMNPHTEEELKENIQRGTLEVPQEELEVNSKLFKWYRKYMHVQGQNFHHL
jgi:hypothetical protein